MVDLFLGLDQFSKCESMEKLNVDILICDILILSVEKGTSLLKLSTFIIIIKIIYFYKRPFAHRKHSNT